MSARYYITTAISYSNGEPHMGHAYEAIATDALARFQRLSGKQVLFATGMDEHGQKINTIAQDKGLSPKQMVDALALRFQEMGKMLAVSNDVFIRTSEARHHKAVQHLWRLLEENGDIYEDFYSGWYAVREEEFYTEAELITNEAGEKTAPSGAPVEWVEEPSYFFRLSAYQQKLLDYYQSHPDFISPPGARAEIIGFVRGGLRDLSITRTSFDWGIPAPGKKGHIIYVWLDALINYLTAIGWPDDDRFWPANLHIIGKDITRFHAVYWPAFLLSAGLALPKRIYAHGFVLTASGEKMSKSLGNVVDPFSLAAHCGADQMRYFFLRETPFGEDGIYSEESIKRRVNSDLANDLGNLAQRCLTMTHRAFASTVPEAGAFAAEDKALLMQAEKLPVAFNAAMESIRPDRALALIFALVGETNRYFASQEPWRLAKTDPARQAAVLYLTLEVLRRLGIMLQPFIPRAAGRLLDYLGEPAGRRDFAHLDKKLAGGQSMPDFAPLFPRMEKTDSR